ncbi:type II toxin-antitoxin system RelE/ParE family toxin [Methanolapillus millepedarum]|uniref:Type II toxin-antitoxin system RelE/ParE family toxin n=1 Tax=Methanolapillus millepedarum TaxID=3028296 RepID=A0AA96ZWI9_9EURY|nr:hypothetical protein MsAc7_16040 [Methanosarcinaceae archaeon Ac7]
MKELVLTPRVELDLKDIKMYIEEVSGSSETAVNHIANLMNCYGKLSDFPLLGKDMSSGKGLKFNYRYLICGNYFVYYKFQNNVVRIFRILNSKRDFLRILYRDLINEENKS